MSLLYGRTQNQSQHTGFSHQKEVPEKGHLPHPAGSDLPGAALEALSLLCHKDKLLIWVILGAHWVLLTKAAFWPGSPSPYCCMGTFHSGVGLHIALCSGGSLQYIPAWLKSPTRAGAC